MEGMRNPGLFHSQHNESPRNIVRLLKACTAMKDLQKGSKVYAYIQEHKFLGESTHIGNNLVNMYVKCGALAKAHHVLKELPLRHVVSWSALIAGYAQHSQGEKALSCFDDMLCEGHIPDAVTFACALKACGSIRAVAKGEEIHEKIAKMGMLESDIVLGTTLVDMYMKCGERAKAQQVLEQLPIRDVVTWNTLIAGYAQQGQGEKALKCFDDMLCEGYTPNAVTFACVLKACGTVRASAKGEEIHEKIVSMGMLEKDVVLGNTLVDMYVKCGALTKAQQVLEELPIRNVVSWSAVIGGYAQQGQGEEALKCFNDMLCEGHSPTSVTFTCALKACGITRAAAKGKEIHDKIVNMGMLEKDVRLGSSLVDMYVKCGALSRARQVLEQLPMRDVVLWSALIAGYSQQCQGEEALKCYDDMLREGHPPDVVTFICVLKACGSIGAAAKGEEIHEKIVSMGMLEKDVVLGNSLVDMYVKCRVVGKAQQVLEQLPIRDVSIWSALIAGYAQQGQWQEALECFDDMLREGHIPDAVTFISVLKACGSIKAAAKGEEIHEKVVSLGMLGKDVVLGNALVDMYVKCGALAKAQEVLEELPIRDVVSWSALIAGYAQQGQGEEALKCFDDMLFEGHSPDAVTFGCVLKACGSIRAAAKGKEIHDKILSLGMLEKDSVLGNLLVDMYVKCGALATAQQVLEELFIRDVASWSALIAGYVQEGQGEEALKCFDDMLHEGHSPTAVTFICALKACATIGAAAKGEEIHHKIVSLAMLEKDVILGGYLVDMYMKCGAFIKAQQVLEELPICDVVSRSVLIAGYAQEGQGKEALKCFDDMLREGHSPDAVTFACVLKACGSIGAIAKGEEVHDKIVRLGILENDVVLGNSLVDMYVKCGALAKAQQVLQEFCIRDVICWSALIAGHVQQGQGEKALRCFSDMLHEGHFPTAVTFACVLKACGSIGAVVKGQEIHYKIVSMGILKTDVVLGNSLVDMYMKCGALGKAQQVLEQLSNSDAVSWNALISGYAQQGQSDEAVNCFEWMQSNGVTPNFVSFTAVLNAYSHSGLLNEAETYFSVITTKYGMHPTLEHYCCMADLFARAGKFNKALSVIAEIPYDKCLPSWAALLGACRKNAEVTIGTLAFKHALDLDKSNATIYVLMADIYTAVGMQQEAHKVEVLGVANKAWKRQHVGGGLLQPKECILFS